MLDEKQFKNLTYLLSYPENFSESKSYPLVIFLHGAGTRCETTELLRNNISFLNLQKRQTERGYILLAPLCSVNNWNEVMSSVIELVGEARTWNFIQTKRVYLTGNSMGGYGTWELGALRPDWFAAIMPICGGGIGWMAGNLVDVPVRTFHGLCDDVVDPIESMQMAKAVNRSGGHAELILFPSLNHNCWETAYSTEANYDWLFTFTTDRDKTLVEKYSGTYFG